MTSLIRLQPEDVSKGDYEHAYKHLQAQLQQLQSLVMHNKSRVILVFEGMDAAGKGGVIKRIASPIDARFIQVWPIAAPKAQYKGTHYLQRFWDRMPAPSQIAVFDRSWYGRVLVERVEGFAQTDEWQRAYEEINHFERMLIDDGVIIKKFFLKTSLDEQKKRLIARLENPEKHWKITVDDFRNREKWPLYKPAIDEMLEKTSPAAAPWHLVETDNKRAARLAIIGQVCGISEGLPALSDDMLGDELRALAKSEFRLNL